MKVELDGLDLVNLIQACHYAKFDYCAWSKSVSLKDQDRESFICRADEFNRLATRLEGFLQSYQSQKVED